MPASGRGYSAAQFALEIEGQVVGGVTSVEGGEVYGEVVEHDLTGTLKKGIGSVGYDDIVLTCGVPDGPLADWLTDFLDGQLPTRDGAVVFCDFNGREQERLAWRQGRITALTLPALDAAGREPARLTVTIRPESTTSIKGGGASVGKVAPKQKALLQSNFSVSIPGVSCAKVASVGSLTISQVDDSAPVGHTRTHAQPLMRVGDLVLSVADSGAADFVTWMDTAVVQGNHATAERTATIRYLDPSMKTDLMAVELAGVGIHRLDSARAASGASVVARRHAVMYCEGATLTVPGPAPAAPAAAATPASTPASTPVSAPASNTTQADLSGVLGERLEPAEVVRRLRDARSPRTALSEVDQQRRLGYDLGVAWAERRASLAELEELAAVDVERDWSAIALPAGHSLGESLEASGIVERPSDGSLELTRDSLAEGILAGILAVTAEVAADITQDLT